MAKRICPKCRSTDISPDLSTESFTEGAVFNRFKCNRCGYSGQFFPEVDDEEFDSESIKEEE